MKNGNKNNRYKLYKYTSIHAHIRFLYIKGAFRLLQHELGYGMDFVSP